MMSLIKKLFRSARVAGIRQYWWNLFVNGLLMSYLMPVGIRRFILNCMGAKVYGAVHGHSTILTNKLQLEKGSFINRNCFIDNNARIGIGRDCSIGYKVVFITANHGMGGGNKRRG